MITGRSRPLRGAPPPSDPELMQRLAGDDLSALGELYDRYQRPVRSYLARATADAADVDDLLQATFLAAAKSAARYDGSACCRPWLIGIATQFLRRRRRSFARFFGAIASLGASRTQSLDPRAALHVKSDVERALSTLSEAKRVTFLMAEVEGMSCAEIASVLSVPIGTVWTRLHAARRELRAVLGEASP